MGENSITLILKDSSIRTYLTASPCYTTNRNKLDNTTNIRKRERDRDRDREERETETERTAGVGTVRSD